MYDIYSPYDPEENELRAIAALSGTNGPAVAPPPAQPDESEAIGALALAAAPPRAPESVPYQPAPEIDRAARIASEPASPPPPAAVADSGDGMRDADGWAIAADLIFNRGRGLGGIIQTINGRKRSALDDELKRAQIEHLRTGSGANNEQAMALRAQALELSKERLGFQKGALEQRNAAGAQKSDQAAKDAAAMRDALKAHGVNVEGLDEASVNALKSLMPQFNQDSRLANKDAINAAAAERQTGITQARLDTEHQNAPRTASDAAAQAAATSQARLPAEKELKVTETPTQVRQAQIDELAHSGMPGVTIDKADAWRASTLTPGAREGLAKYVAGAQTSVSALDKMIALREASGMQVMPSATKSQMASLQKQAIGGAAVLGNSGVLNGTEFPRYAQDIPDGSVAGTDVIDAIGGLTGHPRDSVLEKLRGVRAAFQNAIDAGLMHAGARLGEAQPAAAGAPQPAAAAESEANPGSLPTTGQRAREVPKVNSILEQDDEWKKRFERYRVSP